MKMYNILINGYGNIGKYMYKELEPLLKYNYTIDVYDPNIEQYREKFDKNYLIEFICVPTDNYNDWTVNTSIVEEIIRKSTSEYTVIKSTVPVGFCDKMSKTKKQLIYSPEYYGTTQHAPQNLNFLVLGGNKTDCNVIAQLYYKIKSCDFRIHFTDYKTAELAKYMENCFLGLKVTFCCEFADIAEEFGISYPELREIFILDKRMGESHTFVDVETPYYDSHCLNKDIPALVTQSNKAKLMREVVNINLFKKHEYNRHFEDSLDQ